MKAAVIVFPGSNCDRDVAVALERTTGKPPVLIWHRESELPPLDLIVLPGGFAYGDYLRCGAMAAQSPIMRAVVARVQTGVRVLGICNGFQVLTETRLLPGALMPNAALKFICRTVGLRVENADSAFTRRFQPGQVIHLPIAHGEGNYVADAETLARLDGEGQVAFRYCDSAGVTSDAANPNGSADHIAGVFNARRTVLGLMPHPERAFEPLHGNTDGRMIFDSLLEALS
ncbi:MAG: phosphoribosylformylglycinamidine synthase subunit PurQ [Azospirillaceae bacterium]|nr:phosphoribosylformylglycinamidine synthase subunit PurQ [Azospirillaceae bacterium]